uniref:TF-B3 domain-containing protein n=1 Tax=Leersia perrieri TaxID=77586 RepID=A0A0D9VWF8_9ORYZ
MAGQGSHMKKPSDSSKRHADHIDGKMKCFHMQMNANFQHSMIIPNKFVDHFGGKMSRTIELESPKGIVYIVKVTKHKNKTVLQCGWEAFVDAHHIEENDSLLFHHIENSRFEVLILDSDGCEKVFTCAGIKRTYSLEERNADSIDIASNTQDDTMESSESHSGSDSQRSKIAEFAATTYSSGGSGEDVTESSSSEDESSYELDDPQTPLEPILSSGTKLSDAQKEKVAKLIRDIQPEIPLYAAVMKHSNVNSAHSSLVIAKHYASAHFPNTSQTITLQRQGKNKKWHPRFHVRKDGAGYILHGRFWIDFVLDNRLKEEDICIFVLTKSTGRNFRATVHVLREKKPHSGPLLAPKRFDSRDVRTKSKVTDARRLSSTEGKRGTRGTSTTSVKKELDDDQRNNREGKHQEPHKFNDSERSSEPYLLSDRASLNEVQISKVIEIAYSYQYEVPIYVTVMSKSNVGTDGQYIIIFVKQFARRYLPEGKSKTWQVQMCPQIGDAQKLTVGWRDFVHDNHLQMKDICLFQLMNNERRLTMIVHIIRNNEKS